MTVTISPHVAARCYAQHGWPVFPCHGLSNHDCGCGHPDCASPGKHPLTWRGHHDATTRRDVIDRWWSRSPSANVAIATGNRSRLVVVDIDPDHDGLASLASLERVYAPLPTTRTARTGRGGHHLYFGHPGGEIPNNAGTRLGPGIDIRGDGGYVIAPPSLHISGVHYQWEATRVIADPPAWLARALAPPPPVSSPPAPRLVRPHGGGSRWAAAAIDGELGRVAAA
ncbi:MAG: bifunctional DNA primase/polymerase, partial [Acidimicrobiales bacterium]